MVVKNVHSEMHPENFHLEEKAHSLILGVGTEPFEDALFILYIFVFVILLMNKTIIAF